MGDDDTGRRDTDRRGDDTGRRDREAPDEPAPLDDLARELTERRERPGRSRSESDEAFERVDVGELDRERLWEEILRGDPVSTEGVGGSSGVSTASDTGAAGTVDVDGATVRPDNPEQGPVDAPERVVSKREYCQRCQYFSEPPGATCAHDGTTIVEVVSVDEFRVRNCPMVDGDGSDGDIGIGGIDDSGDNDDSGSDSDDNADSRVDRP